jgi:hypothetical protein
MIFLYATRVSCQLSVVSGQWSVVILLLWLLSFDYAQLPRSRNTAPLLSSFLFQTECFFITKERGTQSYKCGTLGIKGETSLTPLKAI